MILDLNVVDYNYPDKGVYPAWFRDGRQDSQAIGCGRSWRHGFLYLNKKYYICGRKSGGFGSARQR